MSHNDKTVMSTYDDYERIGAGQLDCNQIKQMTQIKKADEDLAYVIGSMPVSETKNEWRDSPSVLPPKVRNNEAARWVPTNNIVPYHQTNLMKLMKLG